jgi:hypothetical protein
MAKPNSVSQLESKVNWLKGEKAAPDQVLKIRLEDGESLLTEYRKCRRTVEELKAFLIERNIEIERLKKRTDYLYDQMIEKGRLNDQFLRKIQEQDGKIRQYADTLTAFRLELIKCKSE